MYLNKAIIFGNLTRDPEIKALPSGVKVASFSIATNRVYKDKAGARQEQSEFHNVRHACFRRRRLATTSRASWVVSARRGTTATGRPVTVTLGEVVPPRRAPRLGGCSFPVLPGVADESELSLA